MIPVLFTRTRPARPVIPRTYISRSSTKSAKIVIPTWEGRGARVNDDICRSRAPAWERQIEKAPLDNNICERALKMAILHRKNSLFYKTEHGAYIGDLFMSLIHTSALAKINPFEYLTSLQQNTSDLFANPSPGCLGIIWQTYPHPFVK